MVDLQQQHQRQRVESNDMDLEQYNSALDTLSSLQIEGSIGMNQEDSLTRCHNNGNDKNNDDSSSEHERNKCLVIDRVVYFNRFIFSSFQITTITISNDQILQIPQLRASAESIVIARCDIESRRWDRNVELKI
ncbi:hypothetical protein Glove_177g77 [Diversispora epigaea]|uniref:Uncharacterized protein n=1 Tax=Diversispora epigaea TaxID=1348612 RepID=A0A397INC8_9GLOM|nr:hypothetical protein Glove_177g77 [Diversispora epigaea]